MATTATLEPCADTPKEAVTSSSNELVAQRSSLTKALAESPQDAVLYLARGAVHGRLGYPDLAAGDAYRALLLLDDITDGAEYDDAEDALRSWDAASLEAALQDRTGDKLVNLALAGARTRTSSHGSEDETRLAAATLLAHRLLSACLLACGCLRSAATFAQSGLRSASQDEVLLSTLTATTAAAVERTGDADVALHDYPDIGKARREIYAWNNHEPDRFSPESLAELRARFKEAAPKCEVRATELPSLREGDEEGTSKQLGVFAAEDIAPGEIVLKEYSLITACNRLGDSVCDACSVDIDEEPVACDECDVVFCSQECLEKAAERYHPTVCGLDEFDAIGKDPKPREADSALYLLLLARVLAIATHTDLHPLDVPEVKFLWGDFTPPTPVTYALPFSFKYTIAEPIRVLQSLELDIFDPAYDTWVLNTLYAKFRGVASARTTRLGKGPEVAAVHPLWCLANHDCDPNVAWEWGGRIAMTARSQRMVTGVLPGLRAGEEVLSHYCDIELPVKERREWASGPLGGDCMCSRCCSEAAEASKTLKATA